MNRSVEENQACCTTSGTRSGESHRCGCGRRRALSCTTVGCMRGCYAKPRAAISRNQHHSCTAHRFRRAQRDSAGARPVLLGSRIPSRNPGAASLGQTCVVGQKKHCAEDHHACWEQTHCTAYNTPNNRDYPTRRAAPRPGHGCYMVGGLYKELISVVRAGGVL